MEVSWNRSRNKELDSRGKPKKAFHFKQNKIIFVKENNSSLQEHLERLKTSTANMGTAH